MRTKILVYFIVVLLLMHAVNALVTVNPTSASLTYIIGNAQPSKVITFTNNANESVTLTLTKTAAFTNITNTAPIIPANSSVDITFPLYIPGNTAAGTYVDYINYAYPNVSSQQIPFIIEVQSGNTQVGNCKLIPTITNYITTIKTGTTPFTKTFGVIIAKGCTEAVDIGTPIINGVTETSDGSKPIALTGALSLGPKEPNTQANFDIQFDVTGLPSGTYSPTIIIPGIYNGDQLQATMSFSVIVTGSLGPITSQLQPPKYTIPNQVAKGTQFEITATDLDPNLQPTMFPNPALTGISVVRKETTWTWTGIINTTGKYEVSITSLYSGGQIGEAYTKTITVTESGSAIITGNMSFQFYPSLDQLQDGDNVTILVRDGSKIVDDAILYVDGVKTDERTFIVHAGEGYHLSASNPSYTTIDYILQVSNREVNIIITPTDPELGEAGSISVIDATAGGIVVGATITFDGATLQGNNFQASQVGPHTIMASAPGYAPKTVSMNINPVTTIIEAPNKISKDEPATIKISRDTAWAVMLTTDNASTIIAQGNVNPISFTPTERGTYTVTVRDKQIKVYTIQGFDFKNIPSWIWIGLGVILIIIIIFILARKKSGGGGMGYGLPDGGQGMFTPIN